MSPFDALSRASITSLQDVFGSRTAFVYSRPAGREFDAVAPFAITAALNSGGEAAGPAGPVAGSLLVKPEDVPLGPQKGDIVTISAAPSPMKSGNYRVQEIVMDAAAGWASLGLRFVS